MLANGATIEHVRSSNFISEMVDSFNVSGIQTGSGTKVAMIVGRDMIAIQKETLVADNGNFRPEVRPEDMILTRHIVANLTIPLENAKALVIALQTAIQQMEAAAEAHAKSFQG